MTLIAPPLEIININKNFKNINILDDINLTIDSGKIYGLVGVNGAGKTTLIKIIIDLLKADSGEIKLFGISSLKPEARKEIAYLPEKFQPSPLLTAYEFLSINLSYYNKKLDKEAAGKKAEKLGLDPAVLNNKIGKYSKGMGQKLGLLLMFLSDCKLLILDEPMSGLDPRARIQLKELLIDYKNAGNAIFFSSHILADIEEICDETAIIHNCKILHKGPAKDFLKNYKEKNLERAFLKVINEA